MNFCLARANTVLLSVCKCTIAPGIQCPTVGGIKTVTFPFRLNGIRPFRSPFSSRFARASDQLTRWACLTNVSGTRASSFAREPRIDGCTLPLPSKLHCAAAALLILACFAIAARLRAIFAIVDRLTSDR